MKQYLLSVYQPSGPRPDPEVLARIARDLDALNAEMQAAGAWVFAGGLHDPSTQVALTLRLLGGLQTAEIARAFLVSEPTMAQRLLEARRPARAAAAGDLVTLAEQDRGRWDRALIAEGQALVRRCLARNQPGPYQIQAAINAVHSDAPAAAATDWAQILALYDQLLAVAPTPVVALNRAVAVAEIEGPQRALTLVEELDLEAYHLFHAIRAELLERLGRSAEAADAYDAALARTQNEAERRFLVRARDEFRRARRSEG
jgi:predicted RNA polymerase sigma factor